VRAVATAAVRDATNQQELLARASAALGSDVEIISGQEEARLIHLGVQSRWPHPKERFLIIDIGGGSAEIILSDDDRIGQAFSKPLGALRLQELFLRTDPPRASELHRLEEYIAERIGPAVRRIEPIRIDRVVGTSATASAVVCAANRIPRPRREEADRQRATTAHIRRLYREICTLDANARQRITGIGPRRAEIIIPGTAVLLRILEALNMPALFYSSAGVRDGIIADLAARGAGSSLSQLTEDQRRVVQTMAARYGVQAEHAHKVASLAHDLFLALTPLHKLPPQQGRMLEAAAYLHDIGHYVSDTGHHKHSYYLVLNSDMAGFTDAERQFIASLCRYHRRSSPTPRHPQFQALDANGRQSLILLTPLLRLADSLDRGHAQRVGRITVELRSGNVVLTLHPGGELELEMWAAERIADLFHETYGVPLVVNVAQTKPPAPSLLSGTTAFVERPGAPPGSRGSA
jgi:exopolyphosphatase/guanosine-5'-triphosphate,3'-diphosphate pyrophosphatase